MEYDLSDAPRYSINRREEVQASETCGCFCCLSTFRPDEITEWVGTSTQDEFAMYLVCGIDAVIGSGSGYSITIEFLSMMNDRWFDSDKPTIASLE